MFTTVLLSLLLATRAASIQSQLERLSVDDPNWPFHPKYVALSKTRFVGTVRDQGLTEQLVLFRVDERSMLHEITRQEVLLARTLELRDVDGDGRAEILSGGWQEHDRLAVLRWTDDTLTLIGEDGKAGFVDLDHDGTLEMISPCACGAGHCGYRPCAGVQRLRDGRYVRDETTYGAFDEWKKPDGKPWRQTRKVSVADDAPLDAVIHLINGERGGRHRVTSIELEVDGRPVPLRLDRGVEFLDVPVTFASHCPDVAVTLHGPKGAVARMLVELKKGEE
jgi:hypothetical protein